MFFDVITYQGPTGSPKNFLCINQAPAKTRGYAMRETFLKYFTKDTIDIQAKVKKRGKNKRHRDLKSICPSLITRGNSGSALRVYTKPSAVIFSSVESYIHEQFSSLFRQRTGTAVNLKKWSAHNRVQLNSGQCDN